MSVRGRVIVSKRGELSVLASSWHMAAKALRPLPVAFADMSEDMRVRHRYTDLIMREKARENALTRIKVMRALRNYLESQGFLEAETPMLQTLHGGAAARPFVTHSNALDIDLYLRIAPELYLMRCRWYRTGFRGESEFPQRGCGFLPLPGVRHVGDLPGVGHLR